MPDDERHPGDAGGPTEAGGSGAPDGDAEAPADLDRIEGMRRVDRLTRELVRTATELAAVGEALDNPAIERNAGRIRDSARVLAENVPRERLED